MIANLSYGPSFGTVREIEFARRQGKPVVVITQMPLLSLTAWDLMQAVDWETALLAVLEAVQEGRDIPPHGLAVLLGEVRREPPEDEE
jgi:hypothetical protein